MITFFLDTNRINARKNCPFMNVLEDIALRGKCELLMPRVAWGEAKIGKNQKRKEKTWSYFYIGLERTKSQKYWYKEVESIIFPSGARTQNEVNDIWILVTAREMNYSLVTNDGASKTQEGGMLGYRIALNKMGINVLRDYEAVEKVLEIIDP